MSHCAAGTCCAPHLYCIDLQRQAIQRVPRHAPLNVADHNEPHKPLPQRRSGARHRRCCRQAAHTRRAVHGCTPARRLGMQQHGGMPDETCAGWQACKLVLARWAAARTALPMSTIGLHGVWGMCAGMTGVPQCTVHACMHVWGRLSLVAQRLTLRGASMSVSHTRLMNSVHAAASKPCTCNDERHVGMCTRRHMPHHALHGRPAQRHAAVGQCTAHLTCRCDSCSSLTSCSICSRRLSSLYPHSYARMAFAVNSCRASWHTDPVEGCSRQHC